MVSKATFFQLNNLHNVSCFKCKPGILLVRTSETSPKSASIMKLAVDEFYLLSSLTSSQCTASSSKHIIALFVLERGLNREEK